MAIYIFSLLVGYVPNGVDYAQGYRARMLKKYTNSVKYIFTELPTREDVNLYRKAGIGVEQMLRLQVDTTRGLACELHRIARI